MARTSAVPVLPGAWPVLGHAIPLVRDPLAFFTRFPGHGPVVQIRIGPRPAYAITRPELVWRILVDDQRFFDKGGPWIETGRAVVGSGLATCPAGDHPRQRSMMQPAFHHTRLAQYAEIMQGCIDEVVGSWRPGAVVHLSEEMHRLTALVTSRTLFHAEAGEPAAEHIVRTLPELLDGMFWRMLMPEPVRALPLPVNRRVDRHMAELRRLVGEVVSYYQRTGHDYGDLGSMVVTGSRNDPVLEAELFAQVVTILVAGVETAASALTWAIRLLARHPDVAARVRTEAREALGDRAPRYEDLPRLAYAQCVLTEALRLYPSAWMMSRSVLEDVPVAGFVLPAGADVFFSPYALHRTEAVFTDAERFDPDRWLPERVTSAQRRSFFAFGAGSRKCIGDRFGMCETTLALTALLGRWEFRPEPGDREKPTLRMLLAPPPTRVRLEPRG